MNLLYSANILYNILATLNNKMTGHHPSIKNSAIFNYLLNKNSEKNEQIQNNIESILLSLEKEKKIKNKGNEVEENEDMEMDGEEMEEIEDNEEGEEIEDEIEEGEENEEKNLKKKKDSKIKENKKEKNKIISNNILDDIKESVKKPSFLNKKKREKKWIKKLI